MDIKKNPIKNKRPLDDTKKKVRRSKPYPIVAIGASAGGLEAVTELLKNLQPDTGMAFVYIQHLDPTHESMLTPILSKVTRMKVMEAKNFLKIMPDHLFIIPPNKEMSIIDGVIKLNPRPPKPVISLPINRFFSSLAEKQKDGAIGVVLSGNASDGATGLKAIKSAGGITFAQDETAKFQSMPRSAVAEGGVDLVLSPREIAKELERISKKTSLLQIKDYEEEEDTPADNLPENDSADLDNILQLIKKSTGVDFSHYKKATIKRRLLRRMQLYQHDDIKQYWQYLKQHTSEIDVLYNDLLINVTSFFRDTELCRYLEKKIAA